MALFWDYWEAKAVRKNEKAARKDANIYGNVIHPNMFAGGTIDDSTPIILIVPPPELHLLIGPVNMMYVVDELCKVWPTCQQWIKRLHIKREDYHGGSFNGNDSRKLSKNVPILEKISQSSNPKVQGYVNAFKVRDTKYPEYGERLLKAVIMYNSQHL